MSLLEPTPGEMCDRVTIIALKQESGNKAPHLEKERAALMGQLVKLVMLPEKGARCGGYVHALAAVNAFIWHKEAEIRELIRARRHQDPMNDDADAGALAKEIRKLADRRHQLIAEIDKLFGDPRAGKEKSWMQGEAEKAVGPEVASNVYREGGMAVAAAGGPVFGFSGFAPKLDTPSYKMQCPACGGPVRWEDEEMVRCQTCKARTDGYEAMKAFENREKRAAEDKAFAEATASTRTVYSLVKVKPGVHLVGLDAPCPTCETVRCKIPWTIERSVR